MLKLQVNQLKKAFNGQEILKAISFSANKGDVIAILGSSGSGKSTLLRCINLLALPDGGDIHIDELAIHFNLGEKTILTQRQVIALRKKIGMVFQQFNLWMHMTVLQNLIEAPRQVLKLDKTQAIAEAEILLKKVGLFDKINCYPAQLSGGQQQRAAIARALMMKPEIMLFDEPTSALDPEMVSEVLAVMQELALEGMTMLIATHELNFARKVASHTLFLDEGKILEQGDTNLLFDQPQSLRFKNFLQAMRH